MEYNKQYLNVKITNKCNGNCLFCLDENKIRKEEPVEKLIEATNFFYNYKNVLISGGEPFLYNNLLEYLKGISKEKEEIYITTNGSAFNNHNIEEIAKYIKTIDISIHHYNQILNSSIFGVSIDFNNIKENIKKFKNAGVNVIINVNLIKDYIDYFRKAKEMIEFAKDLGADMIRFTELQNNLSCFVSAYEVFNLKNDNSNFNEIEIDTKMGIKTIIRFTSILTNPKKEQLGNVKSVNINDISNVGYFKASARNNIYSSDSILNFSAIAPDDLHANIISPQEE